LTTLTADGMDLNARVWKNSMASHSRITPDFRFKIYDSSRADKIYIQWK